MRKVLFIGGTGTISAAVTKSAAASGLWDLYLLNRGKRPEAIPEGAHGIVADIKDPASVREALGDLSFDCVCEFIGFKRPDVERDYELFKGRTKQYIYISSASAYQKPAANYLVNEGTPLSNDYWQYSRDKIECELFLMEKFRSEGFPVTIVRPSHTYDERKLPTGVHGNIGSWQVAKRLLEGKAIIVQGDGSSLWTMTHNSDFARGFVGLMGNPHAIGGAFQITSDETLTWNQIYGCLADALGVPCKLYHVASDFLAAVGPQFDLEGGLLGDKAVSVVFDNRKLKSVVPGFKAEVSFAEGVRRTVDYILAHPEYQFEDPDFDAWCDRVIEVQEAARKAF